jgi:iron complex outermembrane recepter protein
MSPSSPSRYASLVTGMAGVLALWPISGTAQSPAASADDSLFEVVVTARKREENLQEVPIAIDVVGAERLAEGAIRRLTDLEYSVPGLSLGAQGTSFDGNRIGIRGVSSIRGFTGDQATVAVHLDGVYLPQSGQAVGRMFDMARVEVLKGPQGSLYGRNAVSGVINLVSQGPTDEFGGSVQFSGGSRSLVAVEGVLNAPLNDDHGLRFAISGTQRDGYVTNIRNGDTVDDEDFVGGRLRYRGRFSERVTADATLQFSRDKTGEASQPGRLNQASTPLVTPMGAVIPLPVLTQGIGFYQTSIDRPNDYDRQDLNFSLQIDADFGRTTLRSITGYSDFSADQRTDTTRATTALPNGLFVGTQASKGLSQEFNWFSTGANRLDWRVGLYFMDEQVDETRFQDDTGNDVFLQTVFCPCGYDDFVLRQDGTSWAVFGAVDFHITDTFTISLGARYNDETKEQSQNEVWGVATPMGTIPLCSQVVGADFCRSADSREFSWTAPSGDLSLNWQVTDDSLLYLRAARGFRSGAVGGVIGLDNGIDQFFFGPGTFTLSKLKEETLDSVELGFKNTLLGGRLILNGAIFQQIYKDQLVFTSDPITFRLVEGNLGESEYTGAEMSVLWAFNDMWNVDLAAAYVDSDLKDVGTIAVGAQPGNTPINSPAFSGAIGLNMSIPLASGRISGRLEASRRGKTYFSLNNQNFEDPVSLINASLRYEAGDRGWYGFAAARNLGDEEYVTFINAPPVGGPGPGVARPGEPRTWELGVGYRF